MTHPHLKRNFVPRAVLMKSGLKTLNTAMQNSSRAAISVNTARSINTAYQRPIVNYARPATNVFKRAHSHVKRPFNKFTINKNNNFNEKVNTVRGNVTIVGPKIVVSDNKGNKANAVKASACWVWKPKHKVLDHIMKKLMVDLLPLVETQRSKIQLTDKNHVLLKVPRKDNMYCVDLRNVVPQGGLTCLFTKATLYESNLWHRRLGLMVMPVPKENVDADKLGERRTWPRLHTTTNYGLKITKFVQLKGVLLMLDSNHQGRGKEG
ncbi:hypothetical protein Tco_0650582 [Tanacetum coccineum]